MKNITTEFILACNKKSTWIFESFHSAIQHAFERTSNWSIDWDQRAGEEWASVHSSTESMAIISAKIPLFFVKDEFFDEIGAQIRDIDPNVVVLSSIDFDTREFSADYTVMNEIWGLKEDELNCDSFSVNDLWFMTV